MNNTDQPQSWPLPENMDMSDLDFSTFLDIGDIANLDVSDFPSLGDGGSDAQPLNADHSTLDFGANNFDLNTGLEGHDFGGSVGNQAWSQQQAQQNVYRPPNHVPPTPNSYELQGNAGRFMQSQMDAATGAFLDQQYHPKKNNSTAFTPLVSPAVTPQDSHFQTIPEYTVPGAYFSPLTSPALQAQQQQQSQHFAHGHFTNPTTASSSLAASPLDIDMDMDAFQDSVPLSEPARRTRRKTQASHSAGPAARVRQSPIVKAQSKRRTSNLSSVIPSHEISNLLLEAQAQSSMAQPLSAGLGTNGAFDSSSAESTSPEALTDAVMGPPPRPGSTWHSPALQPQSHSAPASATVNGLQGPGGAPATPASLMSIKKTPQFNGNKNGPMAPPGSGHFQIQNQAAMLEDLALPPAAAPRRPSQDRNGPTVSADATPRLAPASKSTPRLAPSRSGTLSARSTTSSPMISANQSPAVSGKKPDNKQQAQPVKKRGSVSVSGLISPAIRPKISPSIKPLLPEGANLSESQQALLLASKSNYTHLLEGTRLPGVSYPESLSLGLTSKRTSHKLAEQGRRNRMNDALKEMQTLLPKPKGKGKAGDEAAAAAAEEEEEDKDGKSEGRGAGSKAATVESAIDYIRVLQQEKVVAVQLLKQKDEEMSKLRERLAKAELNSSRCDKDEDNNDNDNDNMDVEVGEEQKEGEVVEATS